MRDLFVLNAALIVIVFGVAHVQGLTLAHTLPLVLTILLASIPVALPATFTLAAALGSLELVEVRRAGDAPERAARHRLDDRAVQRQNRHAHPQRGDRHHAATRGRLQRGAVAARRAGWPAIRPDKTRWTARWCGPRWRGA